MSVVITVFVRWISPPLLLSIFPPPNHKRSTSSLCILYGIYIVIHRLYESRSKLFSREGVVVDSPLTDCLTGYRMDFKVSSLTF